MIAAFGSSLLYNSQMRLHKWLLWGLLWQACLQKAEGVKSSGSKRKASASDESEDWFSWSLNLAASNQVPAAVGKVNLEKANKSGAKGLKLQGKSGKTKNDARTMRRARKNIRKAWPAVYWCKIPEWDPKALQEVWTWHCFFLPHEWVSAMVEQPGAVAACKPKAGSQLQRTFLEQCLQTGLPVEGTVPFGLHGDAVPVLGTIRKTSLDFITLNLPSCEAFQDRVPFTVIQTKYVHGQNTKDEIWSLDCLKSGKFPTKRHDGTPWLPSDTARSKLQGCLPARGILSEIRGDWDWFNSWLQAPTWNTNWGMCWLCKANHTNFKGIDAKVRGIPWTKTEFFANAQAMGKKRSVFWSWPEMVPSKLLRPDWLHAFDHGKGADIAGGLLYEMSHHSHGRSLKERVASIWQEIQQLYNELGADYKLDTLTPEKLNRGKKSKSTPTLKALASQVRHFMPLLPLLAGKFFDERDPHQLACQKLARFVSQVYDFMECHHVQKLPRACQYKQYKQYNG